MNFIYRRIYGRPNAVRRITSSRDGERSPLSAGHTEDDAREDVRQCQQGD